MTSNWKKYICEIKQIKACLPTSFHHAHFITLSKTASLAALSPIPVNSTLIGRRAHIVIVT